MFPGDLNGGAENVANCRCWLSYTDTTPSRFKKKTSTSISVPPKLSTRNIRTTIDNKIKVTTNHIDRLKSSISYKLKKVKNKVKSKVSNIKNKLVYRKSFKDISNTTKKVKHVPLKTKDIPKNLPPVLQEGLKVFDSKIKDAKYEYGLIINLTKKEIGSIATDKKIDGINIFKGKSYGKDELAVFHNHLGHTPFNDEDFSAIFRNHNNNKYMIVNTPENIFIAKFKDNLPIDKKAVIKSVKIAYGNGLIEGRKYGDFIQSDKIWKNYINDKVLNKYIEFKRVEK